MLSLLLCAMSLWAADPDLTGLSKRSIFSGSHEFDASWSTWENVSGSSFAAVAAGDYLAFTATSIYDDGVENNAPKIILQTNDAWSTFATIDMNTGVEEGTFYVAVDDEMLTNLKAGCHVKGCNVTLTEIAAYTKAAVVERDAQVLYENADGFDLNNWTGILKIGADKLADVKAGDAIEIHFKDATNAQLQFCYGALKNGSVDYFDVTGNTFTLELTSDEDVAALQSAMESANGVLAIKGKGIIDKVSLLVPKGSSSSDSDYREIVIDKTTVDGSTGWSTTWTTIPGSMFNDAVVGDKVRFYITGAKDDAQLSIQDANWKDIVKTPTVSGEYYEMKITDEDMLTTLKGGVHVKANLCTLTQVSLLTTVPAQEYTSTVIWEGTHDMGSWGKELSIDDDDAKAKLANVKEGDRLFIEGTGLTSESQIQIVVKLQPDWTWTELVKYDTFPALGYTYVIADIDGVATAAQQVEALKAGGLYLKGQKGTITRVTLLQTTTDAISRVSTSKSTKREIFTLSGKRINNLSTKGIYIIRENGVSRKVIL